MILPVVGFKKRVADSRLRTAFSDSHLGAAASRVLVRFFFARFNWLFGEHFQVLVVPHGMLDDAVLQRMERNDKQSATGSEAIRKHSHGVFHMLQFVIDRDAKGLKGTSRAVDSAWNSAARNTTMHEIGELFRCLNGI